MCELSHLCSPDSASPVQANPTNVGNGKEQLITTLTTPGVFTTDVTTTLPDGQTSVITLTTSGTRTFTTKAGIVTEIGSARFVVIMH